MPGESCRERERKDAAGVERRDGLPYGFPDAGGAKLSRFAPTWLTLLCGPGPPPREEAASKLVCRELLAEFGGCKEPSAFVVCCQCWKYPGEEGTSTGLVTVVCGIEPDALPIPAARIPRDASAVDHCC